MLPENNSPGDVQPAAAPQQKQLTTLERGNRLIYKAAADSLIREVSDFMERENLESYYRGKVPGANARTGRSDAGEIRGEYLSKFHARAMAIQKFIITELNYPEFETFRDLVVFKDMSSEITAPSEVLENIKIRLGWIAEYSEWL
jgi:hypothetical protein